MYLLMAPKQGAFIFTGIIEHLGSVKQVGSSQLSIEADTGLIEQLTLGASVAVNGVCLTLSQLNSASLEVEVMPETLRVTTLGRLKPGSQVNLELPVRANGLLGGHLVQGHVDGTATIAAVKKTGDNHLVELKASQQLLRYMVAKGSVAVNGISLTLIDVNDDGFSVGIIPHTWQNTMLKHVVIGDQVNIEIDILAKYVYKFTEAKARLT